ncbi:unnamed protein product [Citrullus colocynthis]|uniref:Uncharacterized protein n=1 Tax=Citrullus colocynthis TaxID=252529 RepID=A0ABP0YBD2_9ROSI
MVKSSKDQYSGQYEKLSTIDDYVPNFLIGGFFLDIQVIRTGSVILLHEAAFSKFILAQR